MFCGYTPAVSKPALNAMRSTIRNMRLRKRTQVTLDDIARELNPITRGWIAYYGRYTRSALYPLARYIDQTLAVWMKRCQNWYGLTPPFAPMPRLCGWGLPDGAHG
jgi:hypothetical protein